MIKRGIVLIAFGQKAQNEAARCIDSIQQMQPALPITLLHDGIQDFHRGVTYSAEDDLTGNGRSTKTRLYDLSPYDHTLYCDVDTRIRQSIDPIFSILDDGFDMAITASTKQGDDFCWNAAADERTVTLDDIGHTPVQYQAGVFAFRKSPAVAAFFQAWHAEWLCYKGNDQAAFSRALHGSPLRIWVLGRAFNGGAVIEHHFGALRV